METNIDWKRIESFLRQVARRNACAREIPHVMHILQSILSYTSGVGVSRKILQRLGEIILTKQTIKIVAPACPDYTSEDGVYTFKGLGRGISLLAGLHIEFLKKIETLFETEILILYADQEANDLELCRIAQCSREEFVHRVASSINATQNMVNHLGWRVDAMTIFFPTFHDEESKATSWIESNGKFMARIDTETLGRSSIYEKINRCMSWNDKRNRTLRTAAQYIALANLSLQGGFVLCNHTTTNLSWYSEIGVALLHNPISIY